MRYSLFGGGVLIVVVILCVIFKNNSQEGDLLSQKASETLSGFRSESTASPLRQSARKEVGNQFSEKKPGAFSEQKNQFLFDQSQAKLRNDPNDPKQVHADASELNTQRLSGREELEKVYSILTSFRVAANKGFFPTGFNYEITNALLGDNPTKVAFISAANRRINGQGELVDKWNRPYFFHAESSQKMTIRSAGPDQKMFTQDDLLSYKAEN